MQTFIIKPLDILETESIKAITERFKEKPKIHIITGAEKVGKTARVIKILSCLMKEHSNTFKPTFISLDNTAEYWQNLIHQNKELFHYPCKDEFPISMLSVYLYVKISFHQQYNFIVIDGIDKCRAVSCEKVFNILFSTATDLGKNHWPNVFITARTNQLPLDNPDLIQVQKEGLIELWHLERPEYLGGEIKEFGDTRLTIESLF
jgi:hypothetical protein